ncbi:MAG: chemotaxis protein CheC [Lachnospiraceae bacterium]|jgi:chemotaxis protein CheC|nr:chemotaxis protein CheC [Lachnospiraceae bacterium]
MGEISLENVTSMYHDILKEIGNIGAGNAMTALSQMMNCRVDMDVPIVQLLDFADIGTMMGGEEQQMVGIYLGVEGDITGSIIFMVEKQDAKHLVNKVMYGMGDPGEDFTEMELSAMQEVGNIITGAYLNSMSMLTQLKIFPTPPSLAVDMASAILSVPAVQFGIYGDKMLLIESKFSDENEIRGYFMLVPDLESYGKILQSLGIAV